MENNLKNKEKITHKHGEINEIYSDSAADMKYNSISISSFVACKRIFREILAMESQNVAENKSNNLEVTYEYVMQLRGGVKKTDILQSG